MGNQDWNSPDWNSQGADYQGQSWQAQSNQQGTYNSPQQGYYNNQQQWGNQNFGSQQMNNMNGMVNTQPVTMGEWIIVYLVSMIPCLNIIMLLIWGFGAGTKQSKKTFCRAQLIIIAVVTVIMIVFYGAIIAGVLSSMTY